MDSSTPIADSVYRCQKKDLAFFMVFLSLCITVFLSALDLTSVSNTLPTIAADLKITEFTWIGSAYALSSTAFLPLSGSLASVWGRRPVLVAGIIIFMAGSAMTAAANSLALIVSGRTVQGLGGGIILALVEIIVSDMVALHERGVYMGLIGAVWALASAIGPIIGGVSTTTFPILAPIPVQKTAAAMAFFTFARQAGSILGITIGSTILQNELSKNLPAQFVETIGSHSLGEAAFAAIPTIKQLEPSLRNLVEAGFADSISIIWAVCCGLCAIGLICALLMKNLPLPEVVDDRYAFKTKENTLQPTPTNESDKNEKPSPELNV